MGAGILLLLFPTASFAVPLGLGLAIGRGWRRQLALVVAVVAFWSSWAVYLLDTCSADSQCAGVVPAFAMCGLISLAGVGAALLIRRDGGRARRRTAAGVPMALLLVAVGAGCLRYSDDVARWGCPTTADFSTPRSVDEVVDAFEDAGLPLEPARIPPVLDPPSGGAQAFRHAVPGATLDVVVCRARCLPFSTRPGRSAERRYAEFFREGGPNVIVIVTELDDRPAANRLRREINGPLRELVPSAAFYPSRCWFR